MSTAALHIHDRVVVEREHLPQVLAYLNSKGYQVVGPTVREQAIVYETLTSLDDLPTGYTDEQDGGSYRLKRRHDRALFGYAVGPQSWKKFLHPPSVRLWQADRTEQGFRRASEQPETPKLAFFGVRSCELHAIAILDRVFMHGEYTDPIYRARREHLCIIAVNRRCRSARTGAHTWSTAGTLDHLCRRGKSLYNWHGPFSRGWACRL